MAKDDPSVASFSSEGKPQGTSREEASHMGACQHARPWAVVGLVLLCLAGVLTGCATAPSAKVAGGAVFYPPLPNPPRIQYLTRFSTARDMGGSESAFAQFVLGDETRQEEIIKKPYGVALFQGKIYVVDTRGPGYVVLDVEKKSINFVNGSGGGKMEKPINIAIDRDGSKYITDTGRNQVLAFDGEDRFLRSYGITGQFKPSDVAIGGDKLYVTDVEHHQIQVLDKRSGEMLFKFGRAGSKEGELFHPTNLALSSDGHLYITDTENSRVQKFTLDGHFVRSYGELGSTLGQFVRPKGLALDRAERMYVIDAAFENVQIFDPLGRLLLFFGTPGDSPDSINMPAGITIDYASAPFFQKYADPHFKLEYVIFVTSQFGINKVSVFGFGKMEGVNYSNAN